MSAQESDKRWFRPLPTAETIRELFTELQNAVDHAGSQVGYPVRCRVWAEEGDPVEPIGYDLIGLLAVHQQDLRRWAVDLVKEADELQVLIDDVLSIVVEGGMIHPDEPRSRDPFNLAPIVVPAEWTS